MELRQGYARRLYMDGEAQKSIAALTQTTESTISKWVAKGDWEKERKERRTTTSALATSLMQAARKMSERIIEHADGDIKDLAKLSDNVVKIMASADRVSSVITRDKVIDVVIALDKRLMRWAQNDPNLTPELLEQIIGYHRKYIEEITVNGEQ